jgi:hypothetical protein
MSNPLTNCTIFGRTPQSVANSVKGSQVSGFVIRSIVRCICIYRGVYFFVTEVSAVSYIILVVPGSRFITKNLRMVHASEI